MRPLNPIGSSKQFISSFSPGWWVAAVEQKAHCRDRSGVKAAGMKTHPELMEWALRPRASHAFFAHDRSAGAASHATMLVMGSFRTAERAVGMVVTCQAAEGAARSARMAIDIGCWLGIASTFD